uniref:Uncharacterized protein n=1 Tax=Arundo donax TaxID=35708 RepID=A0A0A9G0I7_ARUDO
MPSAVSVFEQKIKPKSTVKKLKRQSEIANTKMVTQKKAKLTKDPVGYVKPGYLKDGPAHNLDGSRPRQLSK